MKATLLFKSKFAVALEDGRELTIFMDCYQLNGHAMTFAKDYRFSWIAFDAEAPVKKVLMDQHPHKKAHLHFDDKEESIETEFLDLDEAIAYFFKAVERHFGPLKEPETR